MFDSNVVNLLRNEFENNFSLYHFNVISRIPFNYLASKTSFFWIPYILLSNSNRFQICDHVIDGHKSNSHVHLSDQEHFPRNTS
ncbi:conserved Plasmodium protein, unknown function [Plasmodium ovale curtisi]|nr:conserved Plasmodium protein, unknown function [Plasmodium ovale curtisi]